VRFVIRHATVIRNILSGFRDAWRKSAPLRGVIYTMLGAATVIVALLWGTKILAFIVSLNVHDVLFSLATGVLSGLTVAIIYARRQREIWKADTDDLTRVTRTMAEDLRNLRSSYVSHLERLVDAIGGPFTNSLFAYPPFVSKGIAQILSNQADGLYKQHHQRVLVKEGRDTYLIDGLRLFADSSIVVWSLRFHTTWTWFNDSDVTKRPLDDLVFVTAANPEALSSFTSPGSGEREEERKRLAAFYETRRNVVRATAVNPLDIAARLTEITNVFNIDRVSVVHDRKTTRFDAAQLESINGEFPEGKLPDGIYSALRLPRLPELPALEPTETMRIDYVGHFYLAATGGAAEYWGELTFAPSDIVADEYRLTMLCPLGLRLDDREVDLEVERELSGCQYLHEPLDKKPEKKDNADPEDVPAEFEGFRGKSATITGPRPLTNLHRFSLTWTGTISDS